MRGSRVILMAVVLALPALAFAADAQDVALARIAAAIEDARRVHGPTRQFVGLFLRVAGVVWIVVEWIAAIYLIRGFVMLRRWFAEAAR